MNRFGHANCIECGKPHGRDHAAWRCRPCNRSFDKVKRAAILTVNNAVRRGLLPRVRSLICVDCGAQARDYDHRDYRRPLDVQPTCRSCNLRRGPGFWREPVDAGDRLLEIV